MSIKYKEYRDLFFNELLSLRPQVLLTSSNHIFWSGILIVYCVPELPGCLLTAGSKIGELG